MSLGSRNFGVHGICGVVFVVSTINGVEYFLFTTVKKVHFFITQKI